MAVSSAASLHSEGPLLLRLGDEMLAMNADGSVFVPPVGRHRLVRGERALLPAVDGMHRLETHDREVIALCA